MFKNEVSSSNSINDVNHINDRFSEKKTIILILFQPFLSVSLPVLFYYILCQKFKSHLSFQMVRVAWMFYFSKFTELMDTVSDPLFAISFNVFIGIQL